MPTTDSTAGKLFYTDKEGEQPPLLLVHGAGSNHLTWSAELRRFPGRRVIALDLPGHGRSEKPGRKTVIDYAQSVGAFMDAIDLERAIVVGHSMGGAIAQTMAVHMPDRLAALILVATGGKLYVNPKILNNIRSDPEMVADLINRWAWAKEVGDEMRQLAKQQLLSIDPNVTYGDYLACDAFDIEDQLEKIQAPTLVIGGTGDKMTPFELSEVLAAKIPCATLVKVEGAGHMMPLERAEEVASHIQDWLSTQDFSQS